MKDALHTLVLKALIPVLTSNQGYPSKCLTTLKAQAVPIKMVTGMVLEKGPGAPVGPGVILLIAGLYCTTLTVQKTGSVLKTPGLLPVQVSDKLNKCNLTPAYSVYTPHYVSCQPRTVAAKQVTLFYLISSAERPLVLKLRSFNKPHQQKWTLPCPIPSGRDA